MTVSTVAAVGVVVLASVFVLIGLVAMATRVWVTEPRKAGQPARADARTRVVQRLAMGCFGLVIVLNLWLYATGRQKVDALGVIVLVLFAASASFLAYGLRTGPSREEDNH